VSALTHVFDNLVLIYLTTIRMPAESKPAFEHKSDDPPESHPAFTVHPPSDAKPINCLRISRKEGGIKGNFVIDANFYIPQYGYGGKSRPEKHIARDSVTLQSNSGSIDVGIWVFTARYGARAEMKLEAKHEITATLARIYPCISMSDASSLQHTEIHANRKIAITAVQGANKLAKFHLPRTFEGFLHIDTAPRPKLSEAILRRSTMLVDTDEEKTYFVGDLRCKSYTWGDDWNGDHVHATGQSHFRYLDEETSPAGNSGK
jgi:hypothetical protein